MVKEFVHKNLPFITHTIAGHFELTEEREIEYRGRPLLYYIGYGHINSSCCGTGACSYCLVIGFIKKKKEIGPGRACISEIIAVKSRHRGALESLLKQKEGVSDVIFWF